MMGLYESREQALEHLAQHWHEEWRRCHSQMVWQAIQAVVYVACLDEAHAKLAHEVWTAGPDGWDYGSPAWRASNELEEIRMRNGK